MQNPILNDKLQMIYIRRILMSSCRFLFARSRIRNSLLNWSGSIRSQLSSHSRSRRRHSLRFFIEPAQALLISFKHFPIDWRSQIQSIKIIESLFRNLAGIELKFNLVENPLKRCAKRRRFGNQSFYHMGVIYMQIARMIDCDLSHGAWNRSKFA